MSQPAPKIVDGIECAPVGGDENAQHDDIVAVKLTQPCATFSFAVYGQDRDVHKTDLRHVRVAYSMDGKAWTCCACAALVTFCGTKPPWS